MQTMNIPKLRVPGVYTPTSRPLEVPLPVMSTERNEKSIPRVFTDPLFNMRVRNYYRTNYDRTVGMELLGRASGTAIGAAKGAYAGTLIGGLVGLGSYALSALLPDFGTIAVGGTALASAIAGAKTGRTVGAGVGAAIGLATSDYTTGHAMADLIKDTAGKFVTNPVEGIFNSLYTVGRSMDIIGGGETIRAAIYAGLAKKNLIKTIMEAYGMTPTGREDYDTEHIREKLGIDLGRLPNMIIDFLGDVLTDPGFIAGMSTTGFSKLSKTASKNIDEVIKNTVYTNDILTEMVSDSSLSKTINKAILEEDQDTIIKLFAEQAAKSSKDIPEESLEIIERFMKEARDNTKGKVANDLYDLFKQVDSIDDAITGKLFTVTMVPFTALRYGNKLRKLLKGTEVDSTLGKINYFFFGNKANYSYKRKLDEEFEKAYKEELAKEHKIFTDDLDASIFEGSSYSARQYRDLLNRYNSVTDVNEKAILKKEINKLKSDLSSYKDKLNKELRSKYKDLDKINQEFITKESSDFAGYLAKIAQVDNLLKQLDNPITSKAIGIMQDISRIIGRLSRIRKAFSSKYTIPDTDLRKAFDTKISELVDLFMNNGRQLENILEELYDSKYSKVFEYIRKNIDESSSKSIKELFEKSEKYYDTRTKGIIDKQQELKQEILELEKKPKKIRDTDEIKSKTDEINTLAKKEVELYNKYRNRGMLINKFVDAQHKGFIRNNIGEIVIEDNVNNAIKDAFQEAILKATIGNNHILSKSIMNDITVLSLAHTKLGHQAATVKRISKNFEEDFALFSEEPNILKIGRPTDLFQSDVNIIKEYISKELKRLGYDLESPEKSNIKQYDAKKVDSLIAFNKYLDDTYHSYKSKSYYSKFGILVNASTSGAYDKQLVNYLLDGVTDIDELTNRINTYIPAMTKSIDIDVVQFKVKLNGIKRMLNKHRTSIEQYNIRGYNKYASGINDYIDELLSKSSFTKDEISYLNNILSTARTYLFMENALELSTRSISELTLRKNKLIEQIDSYKWGSKKRNLTKEELSYVANLQKELIELDKQLMTLNTNMMDCKISFNKLLNESFDTQQMAIEDIAIEYTKRTLFGDDINYTRAKKVVEENKYGEESIEYVDDYLGFTYDAYRKVLPLLKAVRGTNDILDILLKTLSKIPNILENNSVEVMTQLLKDTEYLMESYDTYKYIRNTYNINLKITGRYNDVEEFMGLEYSLGETALDDKLQKQIEKGITRYIQGIKGKAYQFSLTDMINHIEESTGLSSEEVKNILDVIGYEHQSNVVPSRKFFRGDVLFKDADYTYSNPRIILSKRVNTDFDKINTRVVIDTETTSRGKDGLILQLSVRVVNHNTGELLTKETFYLDPDDYANLTGANKTKYAIDQAAIDTNGLTVEELRKRKVQPSSEKTRFITHQDLKLIFSEKGLYNGAETALSYMFRDDSIVLAHNAKFDFAALLNNFDDTTEIIYDDNNNVVMENLFDYFDINVIDSVHLAKKFNIYGANKFTNESIIQAFFKYYKNYYNRNLPYAEVIDANNVLDEGLTLLTTTGDLYCNGKLFHDADIDIDVTDLWVGPTFEEINRMAKRMGQSTNDLLNGNVDELIPTIHLFDINTTEYKRLQDICSRLNINLVDGNISKQDLERLYEHLEDSYLKDELIADILDIHKNSLYIDKGTYTDSAQKIYDELNEIYEVLESKRWRIRKEIDNFISLTKRYHNMGYFGLNTNYVRTNILDSIYFDNDLNSLLYIFSGESSKFVEGSNEYILAEAFKTIPLDEVPSLQEAIDFLQYTRDSIEWERSVVEKIGDYNHREIDLFYQLIKYGNELKLSGNTEDLYAKLYNHLISLLKADDNSRFPTWLLKDIIERIESNNNPIFMLDAADNFSNTVYKLIYVNLLNPLSDLFNDKSSSVIKKVESENDDILDTIAESTKKGSEKLRISEAYKDIRTKLESIVNTNRGTLSLTKAYNRKSKLGFNVVDIDDFIANTGKTPTDLVKQNYKETIRYSRPTSKDQRLKNKLNKIFGDLYVNKNEPFIPTGRASFRETAIGNVVGLMADTLGISIEDFLDKFEEIDIDEYSKVFNIYWDDLLKDKNDPLFKSFTLINAQISKLTPDRLEYISDTELLQSKLRRMFMAHYYENKALNYNPIGKQYTKIDAVLRKASTQSKESVKTSGDLFRNLKSIFYKNNGNYDEAANSFRNFFRNRKDLVLVYVDNSLKLRKIKTENLASLKEVLKDEYTTFNIMSNSDYIKLANEVQKVELPNWLQSIHKYLILPQKLFSITFSIPFLVTNVVSAYMQNATANGFHPIKAFNQLVETAKSYHKWKELYQLATSNKYIWEKYDDLDKISVNWIELVRSKDKKFIDSLIEENAEEYDVLIKFIKEATDDEIENLVKISEMSSSVASYSEIIDIQRNKVIGEKKKKTYEKLKNSSDKADIDEFWVINEEPNKPYYNLKEELEALKKIRDKKLPFNDGPVNNLYRRISILEKNIDGKFNEMFNKFQKYTGMQKWLDINSDIEIIFRMAMMDESMKIGKEFSEAAQDVIDRHFIYNDKSVAERMAEIVIPFVSYPIKAANLFSELTQDKQFMKVMYLMNKYSWGDEEAEDSNYLMTRKAKGDIPIGDKLYNLGNPFMESLLTLSQPMQSINNKLNPIAKPLVDLATGSEYNRWTHLLGPFSGVPETVQEVMDEQTFNPGTLLNYSNQYHRYNDTTYYRAYPQRSTFYKHLYTSGGYSRVSMNMQQATLDNLRYRVGDILYKARQRR